MSIQRGNQQRLVTKTTTASTGAATIVTVQFPTALAGKKVALYLMRMALISGTGTKLSPSVGQNATYGAGDANELFRELTATTLKATLPYIKEWANGIIAVLDANARLYVTPQPDAGADNVVFTAFDYEQVVASEDE